MDPRWSRLLFVRPHITALQANGLKSNAGLLAPVKHYPPIRELVEIVCMRPGNHCGAYTRINPESSFLLMSAAKQSHNLFFRKDIEKQAAKQDINIEHFSNRYGELDIMQADLSRQPYQRVSDDTARRDNITEATRRLLAGRCRRCLKLYSNWS